MGSMVGRQSWYDILDLNMNRAKATMDQKIKISKKKILIDDRF